METQFQPTPEAEWVSMNLKPGDQELNCRLLDGQLAGLWNRNTGSTRNIPLLGTLGVGTMPF